MNAAASSAEAAAQTAPSPRGRGRPPSSGTVLRRRAVALLVVGALACGATVVALGALNGPSAPSGARRGAVTVTLGGRPVAQASLARLDGPGGLARFISRVPATQTSRSGRARITLGTDRAALGASIRATAGKGGGVAAVPEQPIASQIQLPVIQQALTNNCETAALSILLADRGMRINQLTLQSQVAKAAPLDPRTGGGGEIWGDPDLGFVGRANGGGPAGGYGVYEGPISALASRHGVALRNLTGEGPGAIYASLLAGHPVMAWVALGDGPYDTWRTPAGKVIHANYGEHAVILSGVSANGVRIDDPLTGQLESWSKGQFQAKWRSLGQRALGA